MFIIISHPRVGSELLIQALKQHPDIKVSSEIFNTERYQGNINLNKKILQYYKNLNTERFIEDDNFLNYFNQISQEIDGFKLVFEQIDRKSIVLKNLKNKENLKIIFLKRNIIDSAISWHLAKKSGIWQNEYCDDKNYIDINFLEDFFFKSLSDFYYYYDYFDKNEKIIIEYDDLINDWDNSIYNIEEFLDLNKFKLKKLYKKRTNCDLNKIITNYDDCLKFKESVTLPKKIHFIWIGNKIPEKYISNIKSYVNHNKKYEIILWTDDEKLSIDGIKTKIIDTKNLYFHQEKNYAAKADILRYEIIYNYGGIYCDIDSICTKPFDKFLQYNFLSHTHDPWNNLTNAIFGFTKRNIFMKFVLSELKNNRNEKQIPYRTGPYFLTRCFIKYKNLEEKNWKYICDCFQHELINQKNLILPILSYDKNKKVEFSFHLNDSNWNNKMTINRSIKISFYTAIKNRLSYISKTLPNNVQYARKHNVEFIVIDYSSTDNLSMWIEPYVKNKLVNYFYIQNQEFWRNSHAKNIGALCASGEIICNLDSDVMIEDDSFIDFIQNYFYECNGILCIPPAIEGLTGTICCLKKDFVSVGGYNEEFKYGWGCEDIDLVSRLNYMGKQIKYLPTKFLKHLNHNNFLRECNSEIKNIRESNANSLKIMNENFKKENYVNNKDKLWGNCYAIQNFSKNLIINNFKKNEFFNYKIFI